MRIVAAIIFVLCIFLAGCDNCHSTGDIEVFRPIAYREPRPGDVYADGGRAKASPMGPLYFGGKLIIATKPIHEKRWMISTFVR